MKPVVSGAAAPVVDMKDLAPYVRAERLTGADVDPGTGLLAFEWNDGATATFTTLWLRDNCACDHCRHPETLERIHPLTAIPEDVAPDAVSITTGGALAVSWPPGPSDPPGTVSHASSYDPGWLRTMAEQRPEVGAREHPVETWAALGFLQIPSVDHRSVMGSDDGLQAWLTRLTSYGLALITDGPAEAGAILNVAERISKNGIRTTAFGTVFEVMSKPHPNNAAYTPIRLMPHMDLPNYTRPPDYQFLYCVENGATGGESTFVDGFKIAEVLRDGEPEHFELLSSTLMSFRFQDDEYDIRHRSPAIVLDAAGKVTELRVNDWIRDTRPDVPIDQERAFYAAYRNLVSMVEDERYQLLIKLRPGQMVGFDNRRVLHGREAFDPDSGPRFLQGLYMERDFVRSRLRVLSRDR